MKKYICKTPFCGNFSAGEKSAYCGSHLWEFRKRKLKPYKELLPFWAYKRCRIHGLLNIKQTCFTAEGWTSCRRCDNLSRDKEKARKYNERNRERLVEWHFKNRYKITMDQYNSELLKQNNQCAICKTAIYVIYIENKSKRNFTIDHCHETDKYRGLLCYSCNTGLGFFKDNTETLQSACKYLSN